MAARKFGSRTFRCNERKFLNLDGHHGNASVVALVERGSKKSGRNPWTHLTISDCSREITLEFELFNEETRRNSLHKVNTLVDSLEKFRQALQVECDRLEANPNAGEEYDW